MKAIHPLTGILSCYIILACASCAAPTTETSKANGADSVKSDPLPSWNEGDAKKSIIGYVKAVTDSAGSSFIPVNDRIATFDNDGTLWSEKPFYFQLFFALDRVKALAPAHPEWKKKQPFKAVLENDLPALMKQGEKGLLQIVMATHVGITTDEFETAVKQWIDTARHPIKHKLYTELVFQPMIELIEYLQANRFKTFIVSGGGIEFMRPWTEKVYGIPKDQVVGSSVKTQFDDNHGQPVLRRLAAINFIDDKEGKPVGINEYIGRKPVFAAGNSDGDLQMLQWTASNKLKNFELYVHHTDSLREWAYDRQSPVGALDKGLDEATKKGWLLVDMKNDWKTVYPADTH